MGNTSNHTNSQSQSSSSQAPKYIHAANDKLVVQLRSRSIILHYGYKFSLNIGDVAMFPHGLSGLKLWQSNIVLARFVIMNHQLFKGKRVLELGAGTGIGGITVSKWTQCESIAMSDSREEVIRNMTKNCQRNMIKNIIIFRLNLAEYQLFTNKYDIILCSQILRPSPITLKQVYSLFRHFLNPNGCVFIIMSDNVEKIQEFSDLVNSEEFQFKYEKLMEEEYYASPLLNKVEGYKEFQRLEMEDYYVVRMRRKEQYKDEKVIKKILPKLPQNKENEKQQVVVEEKIQYKEQDVREQDREQEKMQAEEKIVQIEGQECNIKSTQGCPPMKQIQQTEEQRFEDVVSKQEQKLQQQHHQVKQEEWVECQDEVQLRQEQAEQNSKKQHQEDQQCQSHQQDKKQQQDERQQQNQQEQYHDVNEQKAHQKQQQGQILEEDHQQQLQKTQLQKQSPLPQQVNVNTHNEELAQTQQQRQTNQNQHQEKQQQQQPHQQTYQQKQSQHLEQSLQAHPQLSQQPSTNAQIQPQQQDQSQKQQQQQQPTKQKNKKNKKRK